MRLYEFDVKHQSLDRTLVDEGFMDFVKSTAEKLVANAWPAAAAVPQWDPREYERQQKFQQRITHYQPKPPGMSDEQYALTRQKDPEPGKFGMELDAKDLEQRIRIELAKQDLDKRLSEIAWQSKTSVEKIKDTVVGFALRILMIWLGIKDTEPGGRIKWKSQEQKKRILSSVTAQAINRILGTVIMVMANRYLGNLAEAHPNQQLSKYNPQGRTYRQQPMPQPEPDPVDTAVPLSQMSRDQRVDPDAQERMETEIDRKKFLAILPRILKYVNPRLREVISMRVQGMTFEEIAATMGVSIERARQLEALALRQLRSPRPIRIIRQFMYQPDDPRYGSYQPHPWFK